MHLKNYFKKIMQDSRTPKSVKDDLQTEWDSHLRKGEILQFQGQLREAIQEYEKEIERPIQTYVDAKIVETAFWQMGNVYRKLGEIEQALTAYKKALELFRQHRVGVGPYEDLARLYLEQNQIDEAIAMCQECLEIWPNSWGAKKLLAEAIDLKSSSSEQSSD